MKIIFFFSTVCIATCCQAATLSDDSKSQLKDNKEACIVESGVDAAVVDAITSGGPIPRETKLDCFSSCFLKKTGFQRADGAIDPDVVIEKAKTTNADISKVYAVIAKCKDFVGKDACETGGNVLSCFIQEKTFPVLD
uniref:Odorant-binding protein 11 n=1 Tax=Encarsia formosa TaxID=32400 RepID=A0A514TTZ9_ENCFO|nr:odorant-binding protein 11 [Encarsia formosa]